LVLQLPIDAPLAKPEDDDARERRRRAIESMNAGVELDQRGEFDAGLSKLEAAVEIDPEYSRSHVNLGRMYVSLGRTDAAEAELVRAIEVIDLEHARLGPSDDPKTIQAVAELRGQVHWDLGHLLFERLADQPDLGPAEREALARRSIAALSEAASERPDFRAHHERGRVHDLLDEGLEAERSYRACIEIQPNYAPCYADLARLYFGYGAHATADAVVEVGLAVDPSGAELWLASARLKLARARPKEAAEHAKKAVTINPDLADAWWVRGMALADLRERSGAIEALQHYLSKAIAPSVGQRRHAEDLLFMLMDPI
jgi:tetratricopeptide (TPR) repeat protein